jgi:hypothetical protein
MFRPSEVIIRLILEYLKKNIQNALLEIRSHFLQNIFTTYVFLFNTVKSFNVDKMWKAELHKTVNITIYPVISQTFPFDAVPFNVLWICSTGVPVRHISTFLKQCRWIGLTPRRLQIKRLQFQWAERDNDVLLWRHLRRSLPTGCTLYKEDTKQHSKWSYRYFTSLCCNKLMTYEVSYLDEVSTRIIRNIGTHVPDCTALHGKAAICAVSWSVCSD